MSELKQDVFDALIRNASTFLNCSICAINQGLSNRNHKIIAIVNLQMALELAMKATIIENYGIGHIIQNLPEGTSDVEIQRKYESNDLRIKEFESIKNFLKANRMFDFEKSEYKYMERFQLYRNKLVHFNYNFSEEETEQIEHDIFYILVFLLGTIMSESLHGDNPTYMQESIDMEQYEQLMQNCNYTKFLSSFIEDTYGKSYYCPICSKHFLTPSKKCLGCLSDISTDTNAFGYINCKVCRAEATVVYDRLNIQSNKGILRGMCVNCLSDTIVYQCPHCGQAYDLEGFGDNCMPGHCKYID